MVLRDQTGHRFALVDIKRAAVAQHHVEVVVRTEGVVPRQPVDDDRRMLFQERPGRSRALLVRAHHALRVNDALGLAGRSRREQDFRNRIGPHAGEGLGDAVCWRAGCEALKRGERDASQMPSAGDDLTAGGTNGL